MELCSPKNEKRHMTSFNNCLLLKKVIRPEVSVITEPQHALRTNQSIDQCLRKCHSKLLFSLLCLPLTFQFLLWSICLMQELSAVLSHFKTMLSRVWDLAAAGRQPFFFNLFWCYIKQEDVIFFNAEAENNHCTDSVFVFLFWLRLVRLALNMGLSKRSAL